MDIDGLGMYGWTVSYGMVFVSYSRQKMEKKEKRREFEDQRQGILSLSTGSLYPGKRVRCQTLTCFDSMLSFLHFVMPWSINQDLL